MHVLATAPELYTELVKHDSVVSLLHLLCHENSDISISTISLLYELTDIDTLTETEGALALVDALVSGCDVRTFTLVSTHRSQLSTVTGVSCARRSGTRLLSCWLTT
jgi:hypothetical protein